jgi:hypothetical protein
VKSGTIARGKGIVNTVSVCTHPHQTGKFAIRRRE